MRSIIRSAVVALTLIGSAIACTANVENPEVDQTGREGDTTCVTDCDDAQTTCVGKCSDDTCKASCRTTHDECTSKCTVTTSTGGKSG
jgi:hypothetical protein